MEHKIKALAEAITNNQTKNVIQSHCKGLYFDEKANHLSIHIDNAGPLHELESEEYDHHLQNGMIKVYGDITYELKLEKPEIPHDREKGVPHNIR